MKWDLDWFPETGQVQIHWIHCSSKASPFEQVKANLWISGYAWAEKQNKGHEVEQDEKYDEEEEE